MKVPGFVLLNIHLAILCGTLTAIVLPSLAQVPVTLTSSVQQDGRQAACPGETVIFTCNVMDDVALQWVAGNQIPSTDPILFRPNTPTGTISRGDFTAILVSSIRNPSNTRRAKFQSQLMVTVVEGSVLNGTQVTCNERLVDLIVSSPPHNPRELGVVIKDRQTVPPIPTILQWKRSEDLDIDCYEITVSSVPSRDLYIMVGVCSGMTSAPLLLPRDSYSANLTASNLCNQISNASMLEFTVETPAIQSTKVIPASTQISTTPTRPFPTALPTSIHGPTATVQGIPLPTTSPTSDDGPGKDQSPVTVAGIVGGVIGVAVGGIFSVGIVVCIILGLHLFKKDEPDTSIELVEGQRKEP